MDPNTSRNPKKDSSIDVGNMDDFCGTKFLIVPKGWIVWNLGQDPAFALWRCELLKLTTNDEKSQFVSSEECDTPQEAILKAAEKIK